MSRKSKESEGMPLKLIRTGTGLKQEIAFDLRKTLNELKQELVSSSKLGTFDLGELRLFYLGRELKNGGRTLENLGVGLHNVNVIHVHPAKSASLTWKAPILPPRQTARSARSARAAAIPVAMARFMQPPTAASATSAVPMMMAGFGSGALGSGSFSSVLRLAQQQPPAPPAAAVRNNEVIEIGDDDDDDDEVKVAGQPREGANLLASLRSTMAPPRNHHREIVNIDDDDDDDDDSDAQDDDDDDDCVVVVPPPAAKRQRNE